MTEKCVASTGHGLHMEKCGKKAKVEVQGQHYCGLHDPVRLSIKRDERDAKWKADWEREKAAREAKISKQAELERKAALFDELLLALKRASAYLPVDSPQYTMARNAIKDAEQP